MRGGFSKRWGPGAAAVAALILLALGNVEGASARDNGLPNPAQIYIAGVRFGMSAHRVKEILGRPHSVRHWYDSSNRLIEIEWRFRDRLSVAFEVHKGHMQGVNRVRTYSPRDRLPNGLHVGSQEGSVRHKLPSSICGTYSGDSSGPWPSGYICTWFPHRRGSHCAPNLTFYWHHRGGRVRYIELAGDVGEGCYAPPTAKKRLIARTFRCAIRNTMNPIMAGSWTHLGLTTATLQVLFNGPASSKMQYMSYF